MHKISHIPYLFVVEIFAWLSILSTRQGILMLLLIVVPKRGSRDDFDSAWVSSPGISHRRVDEELLHHLIQG